jgi:type 1 glutamine amidotransferase
MVWNKRALLMVLTASALLLVACSPLGAESTPRTRILFITSEPDHSYGSHMYEFDSQLLASCLSQHRGVEVIVRKGFPEDEKELQGIDAIVFFSKPAGEVVLDPKNHEKFSRLMKTRAGFVAIHWGTGVGYSKLAELPETRDAYKNILGGWFARPPCGVTIGDSRLEQLDPRHPISRGWWGFELRAEYYTDIILHDHARPLISAKVDGKDQVLAWTFQRADGGRSFGTTLGHFHYNFMRPPFRRMVVNGILWGAGHRVPAGGARVTLPVEQMELPAEAQ